MNSKMPLLNVRSVDPEAWETKANLFADYNLYQTWAYQKARTDKRNQEINGIEISDDNGTRLLALTRIIKIPLLGFRIGYVQWGPLLRPNSRFVSLHLESLKLLRDYCFSNWVDVLRITPSLYTTEVGEDYAETMASADFERVDRVKPYHTILFPLDIDEEEMRKKFQNKWRASLRKAEKNGLTVYETQDVQMLSQFEAIYKKSIRKKKFRGLNIGEFIRTQQELPPSQKLNMIVIRKEKDLLSVDVNSYLGDTSLGLFQSTTEQGLSLGASYLAWWHTFLAAKRAGLRRYDMGGVDPVGNPTVYQFKLRIGGDEAFHLGCFEAYADKKAKRICYALDRLYRFFRAKQ